METDGEIVSFCFSFCGRLVRGRPWGRGYFDWKSVNLKYQILRRVPMITCIFCLFIYLFSFSVWVGVCAYWPHLGWMCVVVGKGGLLILFRSRYFWLYKGGLYLIQFTKYPGGSFVQSLALLALKVCPAF